MKINGLILAAGNSSRLGKNKQTIKFKNATLLQMIEHSLLKCCDHVVVVLGHDHQAIPTQAKSQVVINSKWQSGMGSSIKVGVDCLKNQSDALLIALCDQPMIPPSHYQNLVAAAIHSPHQIISSHYQNINGVPAIFPQEYFNKLLSLPDKHGARKLISDHQNDVFSIACPSAKLDIDTFDDLTKLMTLD